MRTPLRFHLPQRLTLLAASLSLIGACSILPLAVDTSAIAPQLHGFGDTTLVPSQGNEAARRLFAQGMAQAYGFNRPEAVRAFKAALARDPDCAMCAWGVAVQLGPNINNPSRGDLAEASRYADYALKHSRGASARDLALIESLAVRYGRSEAGKRLALPYEGICRSPGSTSEPADPRDLAYAGYMLQLVERFPADPDVLVHYAEAEMVATRGGWWDDKSGKPYGRIGDLASRIETALAANPGHVGLNHYMIHAVDSAKVAVRAEAAADRLGMLAPKSPHLLHMPSHTYAHLGRYADATRVNQLAVAADEAMVLELKKQGFKDTMDWRGHNTHFQWYASLMEGRGELALASARAAAARSTWKSEPSEYTHSLPMLTLLQLQRWDDLLKEPMPAGDLGVAALLGNMSRGIAMARTGQLDAARAALGVVTQKAGELSKKHTGKGRGAKIVRSLAATAEAQLGAEIAFAGRRTDEALALQEKAVDAAVEVDGAEPPMLASGPRQRLGGMQLKAQRFAAAEQTFREALALHPASGWALTGLEKALAGQGRTAEAKAVLGAIASSWPLADKDARAAL
ncbi:tetratricopeptide repeat protein [Pseudoduganella sp. GCM10020061]|uniref:tetratricopeptide repeat protein n=1 Tax=Pseudoduganella sp. GCM10020061 TaxID=3317345 RepID=UPI003637B19E